MIRMGRMNGRIPHRASALFGMTGVGGAVRIDILSVKGF